MSNYTKLKTNLKLTIQRLKLLQKKKTELSHKSRKEIADYLTINKVDRAKIRVEHIIREDNYVEAMDILESYCDLLLARFGLIEKMKELDPGLEEAIATIIWSAPRISNDIQEFKVISDVLTGKYGKNYAESCKTDALKSVNEKVKKRLGIEPPSKRLVEQYLIEIAKNYNVNYAPDASIMSQSREVDDLINLGFVSGTTSGHNNNNNSGGGGGAGAFGGMSNPGSYVVSSKQPGIGFDEVANIPVLPNVPTHDSVMTTKDVPLPPRPPLTSNIDSEVTFLVPQIPPPLPKTLPSGGDAEGKQMQPPYPFNANTRDSVSPPPNYNYTNTTTTTPYDHKNDYHEKPPLSGPIVVSDPNVPLPYKPGAYTHTTMSNSQKEPSPPPTYNQQNEPQVKFPNFNPSAPPRTLKPAKDDFIDLPSVPDDTPLRQNTANNVHNDAGDDEDINFDDLQKRFQNLKKL